MNVTINGYATFNCNSCGESQTLGSQSYKFVEDTSKEAEEDEYIRYLSKIDIHCAACSSRIIIKLDVWEFPEAVVNYSYHGLEGASNIECEFCIEHYFDDESVKEEDLAYEQDEDDTQKDDDDDADDDDAQYSPPIEAYIDRYDDDDDD